MPALRLVLVEDHAALREGLALLLEREGYEVVGCAGDVAEGETLVTAARPDVVLCDIALGDGSSGLELLDRLLAADPELQLVLYTGSDEPHVVHAGIDAGARGYVLKDAGLDELVRAIEEVASGGAYVDPRLHRVLLHRKALERLPQLSPREREVIALFAEGRTNEQVAADLVLSVETVRTHVRNAMAKLQAS